MYQEILSSIGGIEIFPVISLLLFVVVFTGAGIATIRMDRERAKTLSQLPLDED